MSAKKQKIEIKQFNTTNKSKCAITFSHRNIILKA